MNLSDYESGSDDDAAVNGSKPARTPTRSSRRLASSDVLQKIANSVRESEDDLEWYGWSSCPREFDCVVLVEYG
ncbi:hypothetical protein IWW50_006512 [Coemansia erecta]|nr:hypothetical protein GGF43_004900 [Coemansia sp. RSA 2618]KAJ2816408.1 hypothetical protein IWW50_006512 [Coemansia erecta]